MFILTRIDYYEETFDRHARFCGLYKTKDEAQEVIDADFRSLKRFYGSGCVIDEAKNEIWKSSDGVGSVGCVYDIFEVDDSNIPV